MTDTIEPMPPGQLDQQQLAQQLVDAAPLAQILEDLVGDPRDGVLGDLAELYPQEEWVVGTTVLAGPGWVSDAPVDLADVEMMWLADNPTPRRSPGRSTRPRRRALDGA